MRGFRSGLRKVGSGDAYVAKIMKRMVMAMKVMDEHVKALRLRGKELSRVHVIRQEKQVTRPVVSFSFSLPCADLKTSHEVFKFPHRISHQQSSQLQRIAIVDANQAALVKRQHRGQSQSPHERRIFTDTCKQRAPRHPERVNMENSPFSRIPAELRVKIYELVLLDQRQVIIDRDPRSWHPPALLQTCQQIRKEAGPTYYSKITFILDVFEIDDRQVILSACITLWLDAIGTEQRELLRAIQSSDEVSSREFADVCARSCRSRTREMGLEIEKATISVLWCRARRLGFMQWQTTSGRASG